MPDEPVVTPDDPGTPQDPPAPTEPPVEPPVEPTEPPEPQYMTVDQAQEMMSKTQQDTKTWLGRRDKDTLEYIGSMIDEKLKANTPVDPEAYTDKVLNDPAFIDQKVNDILTERESSQRQFITNVTTQAAAIMDNDPLYNDKELGNEVVQEIKRMVETGKVDMKLPTPQAAQLMVSSALANAVRKQKTTPKNPLSQNQPGPPTGTITPGSPPPKKMAKAPKLDEFTQRMAEKWGYDDEALAKIYGSES